MFAVLTNTWALLLGMFLIMIGNGLQGTVLGVRGAIEGFGNVTMGVVMSGYFLGFLGGARLTPWLLRRVGHVRVFAALASLISAAMIIYAAVVHPAAWILMRVMIGFCMSGVYVVAESWLNDGVDNTRRGQALSAYLMVQMLGIVLAQGLLNIADPAGYDLFIIMAVAVSVAVVPILLSVSPVPVFDTGRAMTLAQLYRTSPLGCVGTILLGGVFACIFGMASVYGTRAGLDNAELSVFIGAIYVGGLLAQFPIGWMSDRMDRRVLILGLTALGTAAALAAAAAGGSLAVLLGAGAVIGGVANPLYGLLVAYTNDYLAPEEMASAAGGLIVLNGIGATGTPILVGLAMDAVGPAGFPLFIAGLLGAISLYAIYRMSVRPATPVEETMPMAPMGMNASPVACAAAQEIVIERAEAEAEAAAEARSPDAAVTAMRDRELAG